MLDRYHAAVKDALEYIAGNAVRDDRASWTKSERERWKLKRPNCPMCKQSYTGINPLTKEHIQPLFLGGFERADNIDAICKSCNTARNNVMIDVIGTTDIKAIRARMPAMKPAIQSLVIWYIASLNGDHEALAETDAYTDSYLKHRKISNPFNEVANQPELPHRSAWSRLKNWTKKKFEKKVVESNQNETSPKLLINTSPTTNQTNQTDSISGGKSESGADELTLSEFKSLIKNTIGDELLVMSALGEKIIRYQKSKAWKTTGRKALNKALGFPVAQSYKKSIQIHLADEIDILTSGTVTHYRKKQTSATSVQMPKTAASGEAIESMSMDDFKQHVVDFIGNNSLNEAELGQCVLHLQKANGWKSTGKSSLNKALGVPVNQTYRDTIKGHFSNEVIVSIEHDVATYSLSPVALEQYMKRTQNSVANQPQSQLTVSDFDLLICSLIGDRVVLASDLGVMIRQYQRTNQWPDVGKKSFNARFGFPEKQSYRTSIEKHLSESVEIIGVGFRTEFRLKNQTRPPNAPLKGIDMENMTMDDFKQLVCNIVGREVIPIATLANKIIAHQEKCAWPETGKSALIQCLNLPKNSTYRSIIEGNFSDEFVFSGVGGAAKISLVDMNTSSANTDGEKYNITSEKPTQMGHQSGENDAFPKIPKFNMAKGGLRFPQNPNQFAGILINNFKLEEGTDKRERVKSLAEMMDVGSARLNVFLNRRAVMDLLESEPLDGLHALHNRFVSAPEVELSQFDERQMALISDYFQKVEALLRQELP